MTNCVWAQEDDESDTWGTTCGHYFTLNDGTPSDNEMKFCCYCGHALVEHLHGEEEE